MTEAADRRPAAMTAPAPAPDGQRPGAGTAVGSRALRAPVAWGVVWGGLQAASPLGLPWLDAATVYALGIVLIAAVYIGFAVADGRRHVLAVETTVAAAFVVVAAAAVTGPGWLIVAGLAAHGLKDIWQHRTGFVANTRWWPPFCATVDFVAATVIAAALIADIRIGW
ncbi:hypothetical protein ACI797_26400 [Geodermatophilus sp. SYSU D00691]